MSAKQKTVIIITGPTASGKTAIAIDLARHFQTEIISADSRQCYKELNIGVARPSELELKSVPHHFIASHSIHEEITAAGFEQYALAKTKELFLHHDIVVMAGGTGLYIKAFCEGLDEIPPVPREIREQIIHDYKKSGMEWLQQQVREKDPGFYKVGEVQNPQRMMRALEVLQSTGQSILSFRKSVRRERDFNIIKIGLEISKEELHQRIQLRTEEMIRAGLPGEVKGLMPYRHLNALQTVGYTELFAYLDHQLSLDAATTLISQNTRQYAKRQFTWLRKDNEINWSTSLSSNDIITLSEMLIKQL